MRRITTSTRHWLVTALLAMFSDGIFGVAPPPAERQPKARDAYTERRAELKRWLRGVRNQTLAHRGAYGANPFVGQGARRG
jgi:hypothetical protein